MYDYHSLMVQGDHYTMGWQLGRQAQALLPHIFRAMAVRFHQVERDGADPHFECLVQDARDLLYEIDRPLIDLIRGQANGLNIELDLLLRYDLVGSLQDHLSLPRRLYREGCTTWGAVGSATLDGSPILVKNRDSSLEHLPLQLVVRASPAAGYTYLYVTSAGSPGVYCAGINEAGLAIADTHVYSSDLGLGLPSYALMMHVLEDHDRVSSAIDYLHAAPRLGRHNWILADAAGHLAVLEGGHTRYGLFETRDGTLVNTNHLVSDEMKDCFANTDPPDDRDSTFRRHERVTAALAAAHGEIDVPFAQHLMASHGGRGAALCCHPDANTETTTISTSVFLPQQRRLLFCHGLPCQVRYDDFIVRGADQSSCSEDKKRDPVAQRVAGHCGLVATLDEQTSP